MLSRTIENSAGVRQFAIRGMLLAGLLAAGLVLGLTHGAGAQDNPNSLAGVWEVQVTLTDCGSGAPIPIPDNPFPALMTFLKEGVMMETGSRTPFRSPGHGTWERVAHHVFGSRFTFFRFDAAGNPIGTQEVARTIRLVSPDQFTTESTVVLRDPNGNQVGGGCATEVGTRFQ
jgi:hypothetical protein